MGDKGNGRKEQECRWAEVGGGKGEGGWEKFGGNVRGITGDIYTLHC